MLFEISKKYVDFVLHKLKTFRNFLLLKNLKIINLLNRFVLLKYKFSCQ